MSAAIELASVRVRASETTILDGVDLAVAAREIVALTGPSGAGKSTAARVVLGLIAPVDGTVRIAGTLASEHGTILVPPHERRIGAVFQDLALWPHLTVQGNLAFVLASLGRDERDERIAIMLDRVGLHAKASRYPGELSGGERQRVAIARALVAQPRAVVLDEPLSNLDVVLAADLLELFRELLRAQDVATLFVTHDPRAAKQLADRIVVLEAGRVVQSGSWEALVAAPASPFTQRFCAL